MSEALQNYIWLQKLIDKVRHLSKECEITLEPIKKEQSVEEVASGLVSVIEDVVKFVIELRRYTLGFIQHRRLIQQTRRASPEVLSRY